MKDKDKEISVYILIATAALLIGILIGIKIEHTYHTLPLGNLICDVNKKGSFIEIEDKTIHCKKMEEIIKYGDLSITEE